MHLTRRVILALPHRTAYFRIQSPILNKYIQLYWSQVRQKAACDRTFLETKRTPEQTPAIFSATSPKYTQTEFSATGFPKTLNPRSPCGFEPGDGGVAEDLVLSPANARSIAGHHGNPRRSRV